MADSHSRGDHPKIGEGFLCPLQKRISLLVPLVFLFDVSIIGIGRAKKSTWTEWSMTRSTGTKGLIVFGSLPFRANSARNDAMSTTAGTPVKSCINTRAGLKGISLLEGLDPQCKRVSIFSWVTENPSWFRRAFSNRIRMENGNRSISWPCFLSSPRL